MYQKHQQGGEIPDHPLLRSEPPKKGTVQITRLLVMHGGSMSAAQVHRQLLVEGWHMAMGSITPTLHGLIRTGMVKRVKGQECAACGSTKQRYAATRLAIATYKPVPLQEDA